ncbi:MAG TPA: DUF4920 domain-containing protein [Flavobacterium sp.]|nr:DUF4920 domain-containing protein [Flavobacterium sp.]
MKKTIVFLALCTLSIACKKENSAVITEASVPQDTLSYQSFGETITANEALTQQEVLAKYETMKPGDTLQLKFISEIKSTCKKKGCWMTLKLSDEQEAFVKFKDYAFFVPKEGAEKHQSIVSGKAFIEETSVDELKHYAKDAGKSEEEIAAITQPKVEYRFMADGVLIAEHQ